MAGVKSERNPLSGPELFRRNRRVAHALTTHVATADIRSRFGIGDDIIRAVANDWGIDLKTRKMVPRTSNGTSRA